MIDDCLIPEDGTLAREASGNYIISYVWLGTCHRQIPFFTWTSPGGKTRARNDSLLTNAALFRPLVSLFSQQNRCWLWKLREASTLCDLVRALAATKVAGGELQPAHFLEFLLTWDAAAQTHQALTKQGQQSRPEKDDGEG